MKSGGVPSLHTRTLSAKIFPPKRLEMRESVPDSPRHTEVDSLPRTEPSLSSAQLHQEVDLLQTVD